MNLSLQKLYSVLQYNPNEPLLFNSAFFLVFFAFFLLIYLTLYRQATLRIYFLTLFSLYFFYKASGWYVLFILIAAVFDYNISHLIYNATDKGKRKALLITSIMLNLGLLFYFKFTYFFI